MKHRSRCVWPQPGAEGWGSGCVGHEIYAGLSQDLDYKSRDLQIPVGLECETEGLDSYFRVWSQKGSEREAIDILAININLKED